MAGPQSKKKQKTGNGNQSQQPVAVKCTENIAMLYLLHSVPAQPFSNPRTDIQTRETGYSLPFDEERTLVSTFAFLAHIEDDPDHIPAVCLQEIPQKGSLNILLAVNRKDLSQKWKQYASQIRKGLEGIAATLRDADDYSPNIERKVFTLIIRLCRTRILCRLRFMKKPRDATNKKRMTIIDCLQRVVNYLGKKQTKNTRLFLDRAKEVLELATSWKNHQTNLALEALVDSVNSLRQTDRYKDILGSVPNTELDVNHLLNMTIKVSRYRECAILLSRAAPKFPSVRQMRVVVVELPDDAFNRPAIGSNYFPTISSSISRIQNLKNSQKDVNQICGLLRISVKEANTQYNNQVKDNLKNSKVHAEIQLVYYCQTMLQGKALLPRVICSSKSACWLCNTFILFHGKFHMPRSHGRLYPGWRLPDLQGGWCADMATRFNRHLEGLLTESLKTLYIRKARTKYPEPRESDLSTVKWQSVQSNSSKLSDSVSSEKKSEQISAVVRGISKSSERITTTNQDETLPEEAMSANDAIPENHTSCEDHASASLVSTVVPGTTSSHACAPLGGTPPEPQENTRSYNITLGKVSPVHSLGPLQLQFEYAGGHQKQLQGENPQKQLSCTAEWLSPKEVEQLELEGVVTIDAESLTREEVSHNTDTSHNIYLRLEETVLRVTMRPM